MKTTIGLLLSLAFILLSPVLTSKEHKKHKGHLRNDGFYLYDNGLDTIVAIQDGMQMQLQMLKLMQEKGLVSRDRKLAHSDSVAKNSEGTTDISMITFFNDSEGSFCGTVYRKGAIDYLLGILNSRRARKPVDDSDKVVRMTDISFVNDSVFTFWMAKGFTVLEKKMTCTLRGDTLNVRTFRSAAPLHIYPERKFFFVPFNNIPPNLLDIKK